MNIGLADRDIMIVSSYFTQGIVGIYYRVCTSLSHMVSHGKRVTIKPEDIHIWGRITGTQIKSSTDK